MCIQHFSLNFCHKLGIDNVSLVYGPYVHLVTYINFLTCESASQSSEKSSVEKSNMISIAACKVVQNVKVYCDQSGEIAIGTKNSSMISWQVMFFKSEQSRMEKSSMISMTTCKVVQNGKVQYDQSGEIAVGTKNSSMINLQVMLFKCEKSRVENFQVPTMFWRENCLFLIPLRLPFYTKEKWSTLLSMTFYPKYGQNI